MTILRPNERACLRQFLTDRFSLPELKELAFDLSVDYESLPHATRGEFALELIAYFERRGNLSCLLIEVLKRRDGAEIAAILSRLRSCADRKKVQLIISNGQTVDKREVAAALAALLGVHPDDVMLIATAPGSIRLLVGLSGDVAEKLTQSRIDSLADGKYRVLGIRPFEALDAAQQTDWRMRVLVDATDYPSIAQRYAQGVRSLFSRDDAATRERSWTDPVEPATITERAERLVLVAEALQVAAAAKLAHPDPTIRTEASTQLLAKALIDLDVSALLVQAAQDEELGISPGAAMVSTERSAGARADVEASLGVILGDSGAPEVGQRSAQLPADLSSARAAALQSTDEALTRITERAGNAGQSVLAGLLGLGAGDVAKAASISGFDIAPALGQGEEMTDRYALLRDFAVQAYNSLLALLGPSLAQLASQQVIAWLDELRQGKHFGSLVEELYGTTKTRESLRHAIQGSGASLEEYVAIASDVIALNATYGRQIELAEKLLKRLRLIGSVPPTVLPHAQVVLAAGYIVLGAYIVLAGADYIDAERLTFLDRTPGVRRAVEGRLLVPVGA